MAEMTPYPILSTPSPMSNVTEFAIAVSTVSLLGKALPAKGTTAKACNFLPAGCGRYDSHLFTHISPLDGKWTRFHFADPVATGDRTIVNTSPIDVVTPYSRQIHTPVAGANLRVVSDLIPTCLITATSPAIGNAYGSITGMNKAEGYASFSTWTLQKIGGDDERGFTRLYFAPAVDANTPVRTISDEKRMEHWPDVLSTLVITPWYDVDSQIAAMTENINWTRRSGEYLTRITVVEYWSRTAWSLDDVEATPQIETIQYDLGFIERTLPPCLHPEITIPSVSTGDDNPHYPNLDIAADVYAATSQTDWTDQVIAVDTGMDEQTGLHWKRVTTKHAPEPPA